MRLRKRRRLHLLSRIDAGEEDEGRRRLETSGEEK